MATLFLIIIYLSFISLGLPDGLLGSGWEAIRLEFDLPAGALGIFSTTIYVGTIVSSFLSGFLIRKFKTGLLTFISCFTTAAALLGMAFVPSIFWFWLLAIPLGLGAGAVDAALNNYVALHYKSRHMNWLHSFWGVGAMTGPLIMGASLGDDTWRRAYLIVAILQFVLVVILFLALPFWRREEAKSEARIAEAIGEEETEINEKRNPLRIKGVPLALLAFMLYSATESSMGIWGSSYLIQWRGLSLADGAMGVSSFYGGIMGGRFLVGFISSKVGNRRLIRYGQLTALIGIILLVLPIANIFALIGFILVGLGCAPIYPAMIHETPVRFGKNASQMLIGFQMGTAYTGGTILPPLIGYISTNTSMRWIPYFILVFIIVMFLCSEFLVVKLKHKPIHNEVHGE